jgi:hypothetical protein
MTEATELKPMLECAQPPVIVQNLMDMAAAFQEKREQIMALPRNEEGMKAVKALRAQARKDFDTLEDQRKAVKKAVLLPYEQAESLYKGFISEPFKRLDEACKTYVDDVESGIKDACEQRLKQYFAELCAMKGLLWLKWERLGIKVDMATARQAEPRKAMERIREFVDGVCADLEAISAMENSVEVLSHYEQTLDLAEALRRENSRKQSLEIARKNREEREARQAQAAQAREAVAAVDPGVVTTNEGVKKYRLTFSVVAPISMLRALKAYLDDHNFEYQEGT